MVVKLNNIVPFGKYKGKTIEQVITEDSQYCLWLVKTAMKKEFSPDAEDLMLRNMGDDRKRSLAYFKDKF